MNATSCNAVRAGRGFSKVELFVVLVVVGVCIALLLNTVRPAKAVRSQINCRNRLMQIGVAFHEFADDHESKLPMSLSSEQGGTLDVSKLPHSAYRHFEVLSNLLGSTYYLVCPQDTRKPALEWENMANTNNSYFVGLDAEFKRPMSILAGDRNISLFSDVILKASQFALPKWVESVGLHGDKGHLLFANGHVENVNSIGLSNAVMRTGVATNHYSIP